MFYYKFSPNRIFFINEYWLFIPSTILISYLITRKIHLDKQKLKKLTQQLEREKKIRRILFLSLGLNMYSCGHILARGGSINFIDMVDTDSIKCTIEDGVSYLDDARLRNIIKDLYKHKSKGKIIYITATALCHLTHRYGQTFLALPFAVGDFGLTNVYQTFRKGMVSILLGGIGPLIVIGGPVALFFASILGASGLRLAFSNLDFIQTSAVDLREALKPRIPNTYDVVVVNNRDKITMSEPLQKKPECWLPGQPLLNPNCRLKPTEIPDGIDLVLPNLKYEDTVNMRDVTGLDRVEFTDKFDLGQTKPSICNPQKGKEVNFLDKFGDSGPIGENEGWDTCENKIMIPEKRYYLRRRNKP